MERAAGRHGTERPGMEMDKEPVVRSLWLRLECTKADAGVEGLKFYEKWCPDRDEKQFVCTSRRGKEFDGPIVSIPWPNSISKAVL